MTLGHVPMATMIGIYFTLIIVFALPIGLLIFVRKRYQAKISSFFIGGAVFIASAMMLEQLLHMVMILIFGADILQNVMFKALYGAAAAAVFEETGRFLAMKFLMKNRLNFENGLMYGVGHGGVEAMLVVGVTSISNLVMASMVNAGSLGASFEILDEATKQQAFEQISALWTLPSIQFYLGGIERIIAIGLQIAMTLLMYEAVRRKKVIYGLCGYLIHFISDASMVIIMDKTSIAVTEVCLVIITIAVFAGVMMICKKEEKNNLSEMEVLAETTKEE